MEKCPLCSGLWIARKIYLYIYALCFLHRWKTPNEICHWVLGLRYLYAVHYICWSLLSLWVWFPIMQWILILPSSVRLLAMGCIGLRKCIALPELFSIFGEIIETISSNVFFFSASDLRYVVTIGAVTALCSTLMGSLLPQVCELVFKVFPCHSPMYKCYRASARLQS